jgi:hypothetical protein
MLSSSWYNSVYEINEKDWNQVFPDELLKSTTLFKVMEDAFIDTVKHHYLCIYDNDKIVSILPCFEYRLELDVISGRSVQYLVEKVRRYSKNFFSVKVFIVGAYISTCEHYIGTKQGINPEKLKIIAEQLKLKAQELNCKMSMIKEVPVSELANVKDVLKEFVFVDSLPNSFVPLSDEFRPYPSMLKKKAKQRVNRAKKDFLKNELSFELIQDFNDYTDLIYSLYKNVFNKSNTKFENLNVPFFDNINSYFRDKSYLLAICLVLKYGYRLNILIKLPF